MGLSLILFYIIFNIKQCMLRRGVSLLRHEFQNKNTIKKAKKIKAGQNLFIAIL